jgi:hypothetical protein
MNTAAAHDGCDERLAAEVDPRDGLALKYPCRAQQATRASRIRR